MLFVNYTHYSAKANLKKVRVDENGPDARGDTTGRTPPRFGTSHSTAAVLLAAPVPVRFGYRNRPTVWSSTANLLNSPFRFRSRKLESEEYRRFSHPRTEFCSAKNHAEKAWANADCEPREDGRLTPFDAATSLVQIRSDSLFTVEILVASLLVLSPAKVGQRGLYFRTWPGGDSAAIRNHPGDVHDGGASSGASRLCRSVFRVPFRSRRRDR